MERSLQRSEPSRHSPLEFVDLLTSVGGLAGFFADYWEKAPLALHSEDEHRFDDLFSLGDIDRAVQAAQHSQATVLEVIPPPGSTRKKRTVTPSVLGHEDLYGAYLGGDTIRLISIEKFWNPVRNFALRMEEIFDARVGVNMFLTPANSQGFPLHFDQVDVFALQLHGAKSWEIYEPTYEMPLENELSAAHVVRETVRDVSRLERIDRVVLEPGDFFYLPRGVYHDVTTLDRPSLHLTITVHPQYWLDLIKRACDLAAIEHVELRDMLPPGWVGDVDVRGAMRERAASVFARMLESLDFDAAADSLARRWTADRKFPADGHFEQLESLDEMTEDSWLERRPGLVPFVEVDEGQAQIHCGRATVRGPAALFQTFQYVADTARFQVREMPGLAEGKSRVVLARRLVREGLLRRS